MSDLIKKHVVTSHTDTLPLEEDPHAPATGKWYWVTPTVREVDEDDEYVMIVDEDGNEKWKWVRDPDSKWLGCITHIGSNYAEITGVNEGSIRLHLDEFADWTEYEPNPDEYIESQAQKYQTEVRQLMGQVRELTRLLGVGQVSLNASTETQALAVRGTGQEPLDYKQALIKAKEDTLPDLFKKVEEANRNMSTWLKAKMIPLKAEARAMRDVIKVIEGRIFNVELYAGLVESVYQISEGPGASYDEPVRIYQRRHYMDEESLYEYQAGGMDYKNIREFHQWMARKENRDRLLPFPRCIVAFQIRRHDKEREAVDLRDFFRIAEERDMDKMTFIYIRNGEQLYCLQTGIDFDAKLFPDMDRQMLNGKLYAEMFGSSFRRLVSEGEYLQRKEEYLAKKKKHEEASDEERWRHSGYDHGFRDLEEFTPDNVNYDDIKKGIDDDLQKHNRLILVLQGLADRSPVFHPHPVWKLWSSDFEKAIIPVYDDDRALVAGDKPDFEAYRTRINASIKAGNVTIGQERAWNKAERKKAQDRFNRSWGRGTFYYSPPWGNPGPGRFAKVVKVSKKNQSATYEWKRDRQKLRDEWGRRLEPFIKTSISVPFKSLFNVDGYKPGDYKMFFRDPRTRQEYLKWAPYLLGAEDYHAGKVKIGGEMTDRMERKYREEQEAEHEEAKSAEPDDALDDDGTCVSCHKEECICGLSEEEKEELENGDGED